MDEFYIINDSYNWFSRIEEFEKSFNNICDKAKDRNEILEETKTFFKNKNYSLVEEKISQDKIYLIYHSGIDESLVFEILPEFDLNSVRLRIYNKKFNNLKEVNLEDENSIIFSRIVN